MAQVVRVSHVIHACGERLLFDFELSIPSNFLFFSFSFNLPQFLLPFYFHEDSSNSVHRQQQGDGAYGRILPPHTCCLHSPVNSDHSLVAQAARAKGEECQRLDRDTVLPMLATMRTTFARTLQTAAVRYLLVAADSMRASLFDVRPLIEKCFELVTHSAAFRSRGLSDPQSPLRTCGLQSLAVVCAFGLLSRPSSQRHCEMELRLQKRRSAHRVHNCFLSHESV